MVCLNIKNDTFGFNTFCYIYFFYRLLEILIFFFGIIFGLSLYITHGFILKSLFFAFIGILGLDFGIRFLDDNDDDDLDGGKMLPVLVKI